MDDEVVFQIDNRYHIKNLLGIGYSSKVFLASDIKDNKNEVAIKIYIPSRNRTFAKKISDEIELINISNHANIIKVLSHAQGKYYSPSSLLAKNILYTVMEVCEKGDLFDYVTFGGAFPEKIARFYFQRILYAVKNLAEKKIAHRDIKLENVFLNKNYDAVLGDFGFAAKIENEDDLKTILNTMSQCGTKGYQCPELLEKKQVDFFSNDIFSLGVLLFIICFGSNPFAEARLSDNKYRYIYNENYEDFWEKTKNNLNLSEINLDLKNLINGMLNYKNRICIENIIESKWFQGDLCTNDELYTEMEKRRIDILKNKEPEELGYELHSIPPY